MNDALIQAIALITVTFLGILVPLVTVLTKKITKVTDTTVAQTQAIHDLCKKIVEPSETRT